MHGPGGIPPFVHGDAPPPHAAFSPRHETPMSPLYPQEASPSSQYGPLSPWGGTPHLSAPSWEQSAEPPSLHWTDLPQPPIPHWTDGRQQEDLDDWSMQKALGRDLSGTESVADWALQKDFGRDLSGTAPLGHWKPAHSHHGAGAWAQPAFHRGQAPQPTAPSRGHTPQPSAPPWDNAPQRPASPGGLEPRQPDLYEAHAFPPAEGHWTDHRVQESVEDWAIDKDWGRDLSGTESVADWALQKDFGRDLSGTESVGHFGWRKDMGLGPMMAPLNDYFRDTRPQPGGFPAAGWYASPQHSPRHEAALPPWHAPAAHGHDRSTVTQATNEALRMMEQAMRAQQSLAEQAFPEARERWRS
ncbi:hypothetical protein ACAN107058_07545 [Paracidovorax anthurii]|uniref:Uncharacterized protein n=2 Tax=Paracidovorax anthurii TaxID=78229 RepID=A0A328ZCT5_9BURK|nr:hypothetical protein AX018_101528 [Paracidovorax anthurii]